MENRSTTSWPPLTLSECPDTLRSLTERQEAGVDVVQMAVLLYRGDTAACRHLWRRGNNDSLEPWWKVAAAMDAKDAPALWQALRALEATASDNNNNLPVAQYVQEIVQALRVRIIVPFLSTGLPTFLLPLLGFTAMDQVHAFCRQHALDKVAAAETTFTMEQRAALVAFLQADLVV